MENRLGHLNPRRNDPSRIQLQPKQLRLNLDKKIIRAIGTLLGNDIILAEKEKGSEEEGGKEKEACYKNQIGEAKDFKQGQ